jgi:hypothetical protein
MTGSGKRLTERLTRLPPTFTARSATDAALAPRDLAVLREAGDIDELSRGVYRRADAEPTAHLDLLAVCTRAPRAVVCGESALSLHELIDDISHEVHISVPRGSHRPSIDYPPTRVSQYAVDTFTFEIERFEVAPGESIRVYSAARSVVDAMRLGRAQGRSLALSALNRYLRRNGQQGVADLQRVARELGGISAIRPAIEAVLEALLTGDGVLDVAAVLGVDLRGLHHRVNMHPGTLSDHLLGRHRPHTIGIVLIELQQNPCPADLLSRIGPCTNPFHQQLTIRSTQHHRTRLRPRHHRLASGGQKEKKPAATSTHDNHRRLAETRH